jgi:CheY-like chemotaxis protein
VLVVDDHETNQLLIGCFLEKHSNITLEFAKNGQEAVYLVGNNPYDLIFMDINMPIMDGFEATHIIKLRYPNLPIVAVTANTADENRDKCLLAGMDDFLKKPINSSQLNKVIYGYFNK